MADMNQQPGAMPEDVFAQLKGLMTTEEYANYAKDPIAFNRKLMTIMAQGKANKEPASTASTGVTETPAIPTELPSPYAGTQMTPATQMNQFDPAARKAAQEQFMNEYQRTAPSRGIGNILAGASGSQNVIGMNKDLWAGNDAINAANTTGLQKGLEEQATAGLNAATNIQNMAKTAGEYTGNQAKKVQEVEAERLKNITSGLNVQAQQRLNQPGTPEALLAKTLIADQLRSAGNMTPELQKVLANPNITAQQLLGFMDPKVLEAFKTKVGVASTAAGTAKTVEETREAAAKADISEAVAGAMTKKGAKPATIDPLTNLPTGTNNIGNLRDTKTGEFRTFSSPAAGYVALKQDLEAKARNGLNTVSAIITRYAPPNENDTPAYIANVSKALGVGPNDKIDLNNAEVMNALTAAIAKQEGNKKVYEPASGYSTVSGAQSGKPSLNVPPGMNVAINTGQVSIAPNQQVTGAQANAAGEDKKNRDTSAVATRYNLAATTANLAQHSATRASGAGFPDTGSVANWLSKMAPGESERTRTMINSLVEGKLAYDSAAGGGQASASTRESEVERIMKLSPKNFQVELLNFNQQIVRQDARQAQYTQWLKDHNGDPTGFDDSKVRNSTYLYNPRKGDYALTNKADTIEKLKKEGYLAINEVNR